MATGSKGKDNKEVAAFEAVLDYLQVQNRPYSCNDIVQNLHKEHGKTAVQKALDKLVQEEKVREKTYGKQKVYLISQANVAEASSDELKEMDKLIEAKEGEKKELDVKVKDAQVELKSISSAITTEDAKKLLERIEKENTELRAKYEKLSAFGGVIMAKEDREKIRTDRSRMLKEWRLRKKLCTEIANSILEDWPRTKEEFYDEACIETDEVAEVQLPEF